MEENEYYGLPESKTLKIVKKCLSTLIVAIVFLLIAVILLRVMFADYYPKSLKGLYFTDEISAHYLSAPDEFEAYRLDSDYRYTPDLNSDGENEGNFFSANLIFVPDSNSVQCIVRFNRATIDTLNAKYNLSLTLDDADDAFEYTLFASHGEGENGESYAGPSYAVSYERHDKIWIYNYLGLCFENVDIESAYWMRLEIRFAETGELISTIPLYNAERDSDSFEKIKIKKSELPK